MSNAGETWIYRQAWRALLYNRQWKYTEEPTWLGGCDCRTVNLAGRCSRSGNRYLMVGQHIPDAYDENRIPLPGVPGPLYVTVGSCQAVSPYSPQVTVTPLHDFATFGVEDDWPECWYCGRGIAPCVHCGELVCMFVFDNTERFSNTTEPGVVCPNCHQTPYHQSWEENASFPLSSPPPMVNPNITVVRSNNKMAYTEAYCSTYRTPFLIVGYDIVYLPDLTLGLVKAASCYPRMPFFHVTGAIAKNHQRGEIPVIPIRAIHIEGDWPDCPLCGRMTTICHSCNRWLCALEHLSDPYLPPRWVSLTCPLCKSSIC